MVSDLLVISSGAPVGCDLSCITVGVGQGETGHLEQLGQVWQIHDCS